MDERSQFGYRCDDCNGTVREARLEREIFRRQRDFVLLHDVSIGVCNKCGGKYYSAETLKRIQEIGGRARQAMDLKDLQLINKNADQLNEEAKDVLMCQGKAPTE